MNVTPIPANEQQRLAALRALNILDTPPEERFDRITRLAQRLLGVPIALVSLVDADRQWFKSNQGLPGTTQTAREIAFCAHAIMGPDMFVVSDATQDGRFSSNPLVTDDPSIRFYAGQPLKAIDGSEVGTLCIIDRKPRTLSEDDLSLLKDLAAMVEDELNLRQGAELQTQLARINEIFAASEARLRDINDSMPGAVFQFMADKSGWHMTYVSSNIFSLAGVSAEDVVRDINTLVVRVHPDDLQPYITSVNAVLQTLQQWNFEGRLIKPSGEVRWWQGSSIPHRMPSGEVVFNGVIMDITDRKKAEEALRESEAQLAEAQRIAQLGRWTVDIVANTVVWSDLMYKLFDMPNGTPISPELFINHVHPSDVAEVQRIIDSATQSGTESQAFEYRVADTGAMDDVPHYHQTALRIMRDVDGKPVKVIGTTQDITERKKAEMQIQAQNESLVKANRELALARRQADAANKLKSQFLATMSHELRTPLNAVIGYAQLQLAGMAGDMSEEQLGYQDRILANAQHLLQLINEVLDLSKIEAGRMELLDKPFSLRETLNDVVAQTRILADEKGLALALTIDDRLPEVMVADPARIKQIVLNLLSNAVKFTDTGSIRLDAQKNSKGNWTLTVSDTGIGIPPHMQETIFDEFRQVDHGPTRQYGGTGLGLAIVRRLVLMMGGNIRLTSQIGQGSTFTVTLPIVEEVPAVPERV